MSAVHPEGIVYLEAGSTSLQNLATVLARAVEQDRHVRITTAGGVLKYKVGEGGWSPPIHSHLPNGGYPR